MARHFITVNNPCSIAWDDMKISERGRFCSSCNKEVIDFTGFTGRQLSSFAEKQSENYFCGRFLASQLNNWLPDPALRKSNYALYKLVLGVMLAAASQPVTAQEGKQKQKVELICPTIARPGLSEYELPKPAINEIRVQRDSSRKSETIRIGGACAASNKTKPLIIVDGKELSFAKMGKLGANRIKKISVLKNDEAVSLYGHKAQSGVIVILTDLSKEERKSL